MLGVLVEKAKTTPEYYPLTIAAIVTGCNQKSNRDPVTNYDADDVEEILQGLRKKGAAVMVEAGGRVVRWKHTLYDWLKVSKVELAVLAELLLRGPQTEGDLRARASRMEPLARPARAPGRARSAGAARPGRLPLAARPEAGRGRDARALPARGAGEGPAGVRRPARGGRRRGRATGRAAGRPRRGRRAADPAWVAEVAALRAEVETLRGDRRGPRRRGPRLEVRAGSLIA